MAINVITPNSQTRLVTLARVKRDLSVTSTADDDYLNDLIDEATDTINNYTNRTFQVQEYLETFSARGRYIAVTENTPLLSISLLKLQDTVISSTNYEIKNDKAGLVQRKYGFDSTLIYRYYNVDGFPLPQNEARDLWSIQYKAGYQMPGSTASEVSTAAKPLPKDIQRAAIELVKGTYFNRGWNPLVKSEKTGDSSQTMYTPSELMDGVPNNVALVLDNYKRLFI